MKFVRKAAIGAAIVGSTLAGGALGATLMGGAANAAPSTTTTPPPSYGNGDGTGTPGERGTPPRGSETPNGGTGQSDSGRPGCDHMGPGDRGNQGGGQSGENGTTRAPTASESQST